jgi:adenosine kinase
MKRPTGYDLGNASSGSSIVLIAPGNLEDMTGYASKCRKLGIPYICDPGQSLTLWNRDLMKEWINGSMMLITNDYELEVIMDITGLEKNELLGMTEMIITTLGERGSLISTREKDISVPSAKVSAIMDPTGAGDAYRAGLLKGLSIGRDIEASARIGAVAAAYAVEKYGTQEHSYSFAEFSARYEKDFGQL